MLPSFPRLIHVGVNSEFYLGVIWSRKFLCAANLLKLTHLWTDNLSTVNLNKIPQRKERYGWAPTKIWRPRGVYREQELQSWLLSGHVFATHFWWEEATRKNGEDWRVYCLKRKSYIDSEIEVGRVQMEGTRLAQLKELWIGRSFSFIHEARPKDTTPSFFIQSLYSSALSKDLSKLLKTPEM